MKQVLMTLTVIAFANVSAFAAPSTCQIQVAQNAATALAKKASADEATPLPLNNSVGSFTSEDEISSGSDVMGLILDESTQLGAIVKAFCQSN